MHFVMYILEQAHSGILKCALGACSLTHRINTIRFWDGMRQEWLEDPEAFMAEHCPDRTSSEELDPEGWMDLGSDE